MKKYAVIVAGGSGQRMGAAIPKQFIQLKGKPLLYYTLSSFLTAYHDLQVILVLPLAYESLGRELVGQMNAEQRVQITVGGDTRFHSVQNGLKYIAHPSIVFVHDGVRCMVSPELIRRCYVQALEKGSAIPAVAATDSIRIEEGNGHSTIDRNKVRIVQTPQTFQSTLITEAFNLDYNPSFTDEATVVESAGTEVFLIEGEYNNMKVTRPVDLAIAEKLLEEKTI